MSEICSVFWILRLSGVFQRVFKIGTPAVISLSLEADSISPKTPSVFKYHDICRNDTRRFCFYDSEYLCICHTDHTQVDCFGHSTNRELDYCQGCMSGGQCVKGDPTDPNNFVCLCPHCHGGRLCEFSLQAFGFTLDFLLATESIVVHVIYTTLAILLFAVGFFNNVCSFVTFKRKKPRKNGVGNYYYLFVVSILNQCSLLFLVVKLIHVLLGMAGRINDGSCKSISYLLSVFTRSTYWLTSWVTVMRLLMVVFPAATTMVSPQIAIYSSIITIVSLFAMHVHELLYYTRIAQFDSSALLCVTNFQREFVARYDQVNTFLQYLAPFSIDVISITVLITLTARSRAKTAKGSKTFLQVFKEQFHKQKEQYVIPTIIILSSVPQVILSLSLACTIFTSWKRHLILVVYFISYSPQVLGFILYVLPSTEYTKEFRMTKLANICFKCAFK